MVDSGWTGALIRGDMQKHAGDVDFSQKKVFRQADGSPITTESQGRIGGAAKNLLGGGQSVKGGRQLVMDESGCAVLNERAIDISSNDKVVLRGSYEKCGEKVDSMVYSYQSAILSGCCKCRG